MKEKFYTIYQVAELLDMHHKTIRKFIADGKLGATKAGKQWRISDKDLSAFMENSNEKAEEKVDEKADVMTEERLEGNASSDFTAKGLPPKSEKPRISVSTVIDIDEIEKNQYMRISNTLIAAMNSKDSRFQNSTLHVKYYEEEGRLKILLWGPVKFTEEMLDMITMLAEPAGEGESEE